MYREQGFRHFITVYRLTMYHKMFSDSEQFAAYLFCRSCFVMVLSIVVAGVLDIAGVFLGYLFLTFIVEMILPIFLIAFVCTAISFIYLMGACG